MQIIDLIHRKNMFTARDVPESVQKDGLRDLYSGLYQERYFREILTLERKRSERSRKPFLLMILDLSEVGDGFERHILAKKIAELLVTLTRETDVKGWYRYGYTLGVIFCEIWENEKNVKSAPKGIADKCTRALRSSLEPDEMDRLVITWHIFPGKFERAFNDDQGDTKVYPDLFARISKRRYSLLTKRVIDVFGSLLGLLLFSPAFLTIAALIKFTSPGPVFYRQERVGLFGKRFNFYKFRSMYVNNDPTIHQEFVKSLIKGQTAQEGSRSNKSKTPYKITRDPRVTRFGHFLRKTSLDEIPQLFNVLRGDMSLVGPRPPIPYECAEYDVWHHKRLREMKPGITGLWQVKGRSTTTFDEMVRMDIKYLNEWSLLLDLKILLQTPWVVLKGKGAY